MVKDNVGRVPGIEQGLIKKYNNSMNITLSIHTYFILSPQKLYVEVPPLSPLCREELQGPEVLNRCTSSASE